ncbi:MULTISPECIES: tRNA (adenine(22)-N(1))-methyltransferase TrmK [unclassified Bacillus (in: firmicutes)]|uniref:tRNA (adenine(22)-N(1))-methyltransferase n=1 Tax=unclassified Bacillus (in: firmicutes) TaxID=185979 RepID=UPI0008F1EC26|nr:MULTISPECIES: tRNA (adenine(22)-N(1))-methyltransferase TrmK [unclassified Bacillus (in: firmicutes)]SFA95844.1 tRNA (adenine22-N1)-methyltransferase [Bacillus sp. UNCCL13]SFQ79406.1 tRNA (adenine22-N1)-methyltransferase [Bacillus sp. cl95]
MNTDKLSNRLATVVKYIPSGARIADIGSDHAYLPCYAVKKGIVPFAVAGEVVEGPFNSAKKNVQSEGFSDQISVRKGSGLEVIEVGEVDCITIAGMGGALIANILESGKEKLTEVRRLILQPNISAISIRQWLIDNEWELIDEDILEEDGKIYEILVAERGNPKAPYIHGMDKGLLLGPFLTENPGEIFKKKWLMEKENWERIVTQLEKSSSDGTEAQQKKQELLNKIKMVEGILNGESSERK